MFLKTLLSTFILIFSALSYGQFDIGDQFKINEILREEMGKHSEFEGANISSSFLDGFVTLEGYVTNLWQKKRLIEISQNINGVRGVIDKLEVAGMSIDSESLAKQAALALFRDDVADVYELQVITDDFGRVKVSGTVDSPQELEAAQQALEKVNGVVFTLNDINVGVPSVRTDSEIQKDLEFALYNSVLIDEGLVESSVNDNVAQIKGNVGSQNEIITIETLASLVPGVEDVRVTELTVVPRFDRSIIFKIENINQNYTDAALARTVDQSNYYDTRVFSYNIDVRADNGIVELSGVAKSEDAKNAAVENAKNTIGVRGVIDNIEVNRFTPQQELLSE